MCRYDLDVFKVAAAYRAAGFTVEWCPCGGGFTASRPARPCPVVRRRPRATFPDRLWGWLQYRLHGRLK